MGTGVTVVSGAAVGAGVTAGAVGSGTAVGSQGCTVPQNVLQVGQDAQLVAQDVPQVESMHPKVAHASPQVEFQPRLLQQLTGDPDGRNPVKGLRCAHSARDAVVDMASKAAAANAVYFLNMLFTSKVLRLNDEP